MPLLFLLTPAAETLHFFLSKRNQKHLPDPEALRVLLDSVAPRKRERMKVLLLHFSLDFVACVRRMHS